MDNQKAIEWIKAISATQSNSLNKDSLADRKEALHMAIQALKKEEPQKPIFDGLYACPNCHTIMLQGAFEAKGKCCKECGQAIDWSE